MQKSSYLYANLYVTKMLVEVISKYLLSNKRLVVPNLGTFIVKKVGENVLFSNLIKNDDGVLRRLLVEAGISELEAAALIDRFVFEVNYRLQSEGRCAIDGFGTLASGANGSIAFEYNTLAEGDNLEGNIPERRAQEIAAASVEVKEEVVPKEVVSQNTMPEPKVTEEPKPAEVAQKVEPESSHVEESKPEPSVQRKSQKTANLYDDRSEASRKVRPEKYTKGLRYGKGRKVVTGRESATARRSSKGDIIIKIALLVAVLAIMALLYGLYNDWQTGKIEIGLFTDNVQTTQITTDNDIFEDAPEEIDGMRNPDLDYITPKK